MSSNIRVTKTCIYCGQEFEARTLQTLYCSHRCNQRHYKVKKRQEKIFQFEESKGSKTDLPLLISHKLNPSKNYQLQDYFSIAEAAEYVGISRRTVYRLIKNRELKAHKIGKRTIIKKSSIEALF